MIDQDLIAKLNLLAEISTKGTAFGPDEHIAGIAADWLHWSVESITALESLLAEIGKCDQHQFINYEPSLDGRKFFEVDDVQAILDKAQVGK